MAQKSSKTLIFAGFVVLALCLALPVSSTRAQVLPSPEREQLLNGLTILYSNRAGDPNVLIKLRIKSGAAFDLAGKAGTMSLLADAMFPESTTREYVAEQLGGQLEVSTSYDSIDVTISGKSSEFERMIELLRNAVINVNLSAESVASLKETRVKQLSERQSKASAIADRAVAERLFGSYPYGKPAEGTVASLGKIDRADLMLARERFLNAENATLAVVGGVEKARAMRAVRQLLGPWQKGDRIVPATFRQPGSVDDRVLLIDEPTARDVEIRVAVRGLSHSDPDAKAESSLALLAAQRWRAAVPELSEEFAGVGAYQHALSGSFVFRGRVPPAAVAKAIAAAKTIMETLTQADPRENEIPTVTDLTPNYSLASAWLDAESYKVPADKSASRITPADLRRVATRLFANSPPLAVVVLGNAAELQTQLGLKVEIRSNGPETKPAPSATPSPRKP